MSTDYFIYVPITVTEFVDGRLDKYGITDAKPTDADERQRCLTDGENNYLWAYGNPVECFTTRMAGRGSFCRRLQNEFEVEIFSEHDEETPSYVPLVKPTEQEIAVMRAEWRTECAELDRELENFRVTWRGEEIVPAN